jgi:hypothetical protein
MRIRARLCLGIALGPVHAVQCCAIVVRYFMMGKRVSRFFYFAPKFTELRYAYANVLLYRQQTQVRFYYICFFKSLLTDGID